MKTYSKDEFELRSRLTPNELIDRLDQHTLKRNFLGMVPTTQLFIGRINRDSFEIIGSSFFPYGAACVFRGTVDSTSTIKLVTTLNKPFRVMFIIWVGVMTVMSFAFAISDPILLLTFVIVMPIAAIALRAFLHVNYVMARDRSLEKLDAILEIMNRARLPE